MAAIVILAKASILVVTRSAGSLFKMLRMIVRTGFWPPDRRPGVLRQNVE
jgi:hypothetical protein